VESGPALILRTLDKHMTAPGRVRLFGGAAFVLGYGRQRFTEDADLLLDDSECQLLIDVSGFSEAIDATNAELAPRGLYMSHIFGPEQEVLSPTWRERCRRVELEGLTRLAVEVLGPEDLILTKLGRGDEGDFDDVRFLLQTLQVDLAHLRSALAAALVPPELAELFAVASGKLTALLAAQ
jgi:hypothetical protein